MYVSFIKPNQAHKKRHCKHINVEEFIHLFMWTFYKASSFFLHMISNFPMLNHAC